MCRIEVVLTQISVHLECKFSGRLAPSKGGVEMARKGFTEEQIGVALRQADAGNAVGDICRKLGISEPTFYPWSRK
jgi:hypothetical protein